MKTLFLLAGTAALALAASGAARAEPFHYAFQGDVQSLDPMGLNETFTIGYLGNIYEGLTHYDKDMKIEPGLATDWKQTGPDTWRFNLRKNVKFHGGQDFTAEDVVFSWKRSLTEGSDFKGYGQKIKDIKVIDDHTIDITTPEPNPIFPREVVYLYIMDKGWAEEHNATKATSPKAGDDNSTYAAQHANGTGPFELVSRQPDVKSTLKRFDGYWDKDIPTNVTDVTFTPISQDATRTAALISGELDMAWPIPLQDWNRLENAKGVKILHAPDARTIFLGMDQFRDELLYSSVKGKNPLKDKKVREAMAHAIDLKVIDQKIMRGAAEPAGELIGPQINGFVKSLNTPYEYDPEKSKKLLEEAGYPDGFELGMDCPNNRYVNDALICQAVAGLLARVGIRIDLNAQPKSKYFAKVSPQSGNDTSFYLLGWTPSTFDAHNALFNLVATFDTEKNQGQFNYGHYSNPKIDELTDKIVSETDQAKRQEMITEAMTLLKDDVGYLPIHQQPLSWGVRDGVSVAQRADDVIDLRDVVIEKAK
ncbi:ABC transporter substrate-binding protein [Jiella mangrovi]|uniref:ABC transporter substrate-binding protein n=1 Tax=Jiella mangrovi TaxID=2821407 RepID=A0ABS4BLW5_9HYPH|nr:ABC transporter substrate-binding protein [Jiella mangrovi]MBP0617723.1 ABC transporter substrate-binding protein [Jiella mangrovi]